MTTEEQIIKGTDKSPEYKYFGNYRALVVDDEDPRDIGRVKVRVMGVHREDVPDEDLPWALPALGLSRSGGENMKPSMSTDLTQKQLATAFNDTGTGGKYVVPARGNHVWIFFDMGNHHYPQYFAMVPGEKDWLTQKQYVKDKINNKIKQIATLKNKFSPVNGTVNQTGDDWADGAAVNARQTVTSDGELAPYGKGRTSISNNSSVGNPDQNDFKGGKYVPRGLNVTNKDSQGQDSLNMDNLVSRQWSNFITMDVKPLFDKEEAKVDHTKDPHKYNPDFKLDDAGDNGRNINRYIESHTTQGGTTIVIDSREGQENYYFIHKNYMENIDQDGSRKVFIGRNDPREKLVADDPTNDDRNKGPSPEVRSNDELLIDGDKKTHVLGNSTTYIRGNKFVQVDKNIQIDCNDTCGFRIKKGDFDIIIDGEQDPSRDGHQSDREEGKKQEFGDLNISIKNGHMEIYVKQNANIHVEGQANLRVDGDMKTYVKNSYHLIVDGDYNEYIGGNKYITVQQNMEEKIGFGGGTHKKLSLAGNQYITMQGSDNLTASIVKVKGSTHVKGMVVAEGGSFNGQVAGQNFTTPQANLNTHVHSTGRSSTAPPTPGGNAPISPQVAEPGTNNGAGIAPSDPTPVNDTTGVPSDFTSTNQVKKASRRHFARKPRGLKELLGVAFNTGTTAVINAVQQAGSSLSSLAQQAFSSPTPLDQVKANSFDSVSVTGAPATASSVAQGGVVPPATGITSTTVGGNAPAVKTNVTGGSEINKKLPSDVATPALPTVNTAENNAKDAVPVINKPV
jgi:hypothetical protein